jgi:hypothetical protein
MRENSAIFNARHGAGSFHPHRQPAPTAQDCLKLGNGQFCERPGSYLVNVGLNGPYDVETVRGSALADVPDDSAIAAAEEVAGFENRLASIDARLTVLTWTVATVIALVAALFGKAFVT